MIRKLESFLWKLECRQRSFLRWLCPKIPDYFFVFFRIVRGPYGEPLPRKHILGCVGKGWHPLVNDLIENLFALGWPGYLHQVKEKWGGLRFYIGGGSEACYDVLMAAEGKSFDICEDCGEPGKNECYHGWYRTLCPDCGVKKKLELRKNLEELDIF